MPLDRVPFDLAISDPKLLKHHFETLSGPQQVVLKAFNGLELSDELNPKTGKSELDYWSMLQGGAEFDHLGFVTKINPVPYFPKKYDTLVAILGRRSGKTDRITATQIAYEALLGGHMKHVQPGQDVQILFIAQDIDMASSHLNFIYNAIMSSPLLAKEIQDKNQDAILLRNGLKIVPAPPTIKSSRGMAVPGWCGDEVGFWYKDNKAANPDYEVERAVEYAMAQFPDSFKFITSTPYTKEGMLWEYHLAGTEGNKLRCEACTASGIRYCAHNADDREEHEGVLVVHAPTAAMENPKITRKKLIKLQKQDPEAFVRESLAQFVDSISGFLSPEVLQSCISKKITERPRYPRPGHPEDPTFFYVAAMDPAFRHDKFAFTIMHHSMEEGIVQDYFFEWTPELGQPLNPKTVLTEIKAKLDEYGIGMIYSDQYQLESLQQLALELNFSIHGVDFTASSKAKIYGSFASLVNQRRIRLLDKSTIYNQLIALEKKRTPNGAVQISGRPGAYDDAAAACALCAHQSVWMLPQVRLAKPTEPTHVEEGWAHIQRRRQIMNGEDAGEFADEWDEAA
jgi:hypothetical protein